MLHSLVSVYTTERITERCEKKTLVTSCFSYPLFFPMTRLELPMAPQPQWLARYGETIIWPRYSLLIFYTLWRSTGPEWLNNIINLVTVMLRFVGFKLLLLAIPSREPSSFIYWKRNDICNYTLISLYLVRELRILSLYFLPATDCQWAPMTIIRIL